MARSYGKIYVNIWRDRDFIALSLTAQRMYLFLLSQPDLSRAGVLPLALRRWASRADGYESDDLLSDLYELSQASFVIVDEDCEELMVRSYIRIDEGWRSPNMMLSIQDAATIVMSETIRATILEELARLDTSTLSDKVSEKTGRSTKGFIELIIANTARRLKGSAKSPDVIDWNPFANPLPNPSPNPSANHSAKGLGNPPTTETETETRTTGTTGTPNSPRTPRTPTTPRSPRSPGFEDFYAAYPRKVGRTAAEKAFEKALDSAPSEVIIEAARKLASDPNLPEKQFIPHPATWLNRGGWDDEPLPPRGRGYRTANDIMRDEYERAHRATATTQPTALEIEGSF